MLFLIQLANSHPSSLDPLGTWLWDSPLQTCKLVTCDRTFGVHQETEVASMVILLDWLLWDWFAKLMLFWLFFLAILWNRSCIADAKYVWGSMIDTPHEMLWSTVGLAKGTFGSIIIVEVAETVGWITCAIVVIAVIVFDGSVSVILKACKLGNSEMIWFLKWDSDPAIILKEAGLDRNMILINYDHSLRSLTFLAKQSWRDRKRPSVAIDLLIKERGSYFISQDSCN